MDSRGHCTPWKCSWPCPGHGASPQLCLGPGWRAGSTRADSRNTQFGVILPQESSVTHISKLLAPELVVAVKATILGTWNGSGDGAYKLLVLTTTPESGDLLYPVLLNRYDAEQGRRAEGTP